MVRFGHWERAWGITSYGLEMEKRKARCSNRNAGPAGLAGAIRKTIAANYCRLRIPLASLSAGDTR